MKDDSIVEPLKMFNSKFKQLQHENGEKYFEELVKESKIDANANRETIKNIRMSLNKANIMKKKKAVLGV